jgi:IS30 family transposase
MTVRPWTAGDVRRAIAWRQGGMARAAIAERLGRSIDAVTRQLFRQGVRRRARAATPSDWMREEARMAREALAAELADARSERATAPLLRSWPAGVWP